MDLRPFLVLRDKAAELSSLHNRLAAATFLHRLTTVTTTPLHAHLPPYTPRARLRTTCYPTRDRHPCCPTSRARALARARRHWRRRQRRTRSCSKGVVTSGRARARASCPRARPRLRLQRRRPQYSPLRRPAGTRCAGWQRRSSSGNRHQLPPRARRHPGRGRRSASSRSLAPLGKSRTSCGKSRTRRTRHRCMCRTLRSTASAGRTARVVRRVCGRRNTAASRAKLGPTDRLRRGLRPPLRITHRASPPRRRASRCGPRASTLVGSTVARSRTRTKNMTR